MDRDGRRDGGEARREIDRHAIGRIDQVLIGHVGGIDRQRAEFAADKIPIRIEHEGGWAARHGCGMDAAGRTRKREPRTGHIYWLAEVDGDVAVERDFHRAIGRDGANNLRRLFS